MNTIFHKPKTEAFEIIPSYKYSNIEAIPGDAVDKRASRTESPALGGAFPTNFELYTRHFEETRTTFEGRFEEADKTNETIKAMV